MGIKCLLIGGCGFIGSHLAKKLSTSGRSITILDRREPLEHEKLDGVSYVSGDFSSPKLISQLASTHEEIVHLAYATQPKTSFDDPLADLQMNLSPAVQLFEIAARYDVRLLLVSSGGTVYGEAISSPITEDHPMQPISPYGITKLALEKYASLYAVTKGLNVVCVRPSNPYGEGQLPFTGQGFVSTAIATALKGEAINIFGARGTIRDYIYISDLVDGMITVLEKGEANESYNIGSGYGLTNLQIIEESRPFFDSSGIDLHVKHGPQRPFDVKVNILDSQKLKSLGWKPMIDINSGLKCTFDWLQQYVHANP